MRYLQFIVFLILVSGCSLAPDFERPNVYLPDKYNEASVMGDSLANLSWWDLFKDPVLQDIIRISLTENRDIQVAAARIEEVRGLLGFTRANQFPLLNGGGSAARVDPSNQLFRTDNEARGDYALGTDLSFELDFWGRLSNATAAARAQLLATEQSYRFVTMSLISQTAINYFLILDLNARLAISRQTLKNRADATGVIKARFDKGVVAEIDLNQAQIEQADAAIIATATERELGLAKNALRVLLGSATYSIPSIADLNSQVLPTNLPTIFPAELLIRRPDLLASEEIAKAAVARIGVARADQFPTFNLLGAIGFASDETSNLLSRSALTWNIGGNFIGPLIDFGKSASRVDVAEAQAKQALLNYEQNVITAVQEVEDALVQLKTYNEENVQRLLQVKAASNASRLSWARYNDGFTSYLEVLDIDRSLFDAQLGSSNTKQQYLSSVVRLYKALGGGWSNSSDTAGPLYVEVK